MATALFPVPYSLSPVLGDERPPGSPLPMWEGWPPRRRARAPVCGVTQDFDSVLRLGARVVDAGLQAHLRLGRSAWHPAGRRPLAVGAGRSPPLLASSPAGPAPCQAAGLDARRTRQRT